MSDDSLVRHIDEFTAPVAGLEMTKRMQGVVRDLAVAARAFEWRGRPGAAVSVDDHDGIPRLTVTVPEADGHATRLQADVTVSVPAREQIRDLIWEYVRAELDASLTFG